MFCLTREDEAGRRDGIAWLDLLTAGCSCTLNAAQPCTSEHQCFISPSWLGIEIKLEDKAEKQLIILLAAGVQAGSLILLFSYYLLLVRKGKKKAEKFENPLVFMFFDRERSELSSSLNTDFMLALPGQFRSPPKKYVCVYRYVYNHH